MNHLQLGEYSDLPSSEPELVPELSVTGISLTVSENGAAHVVGTSVILDADGHPQERRIVLRFAVQASLVGAFKAWAAGDQERQEQKREAWARELRNHH